MEPVTKEVLVIDSVATGALVRDRRKAVGMTLAKLSELTGIHESFLSDLENARRDWSKEKFEVVNKVLEGEVVW